jgi:hypothetical protein
MVYLFRSVCRFTSRPARSAKCAGAQEKEISPYKNKIKATGAEIKPLCKFSAAFVQSFRKGAADKWPFRPERFSIFWGQGGTAIFCPRLKSYANEKSPLQHYCGKVAFPTSTDVIVLL